MTKAELATLIMKNNDEYKKSHLAKMHLADLMELAAPYIEAAEMPINENESTPHTVPLEHTVSMTQNHSVSAMADEVAQVYDEDAKMVKGPRLDKTEFRKVAIEKSLAQLLPEDALESIREVTVSTIKELLQN